MTDQIKPASDHDLEVFFDELALVETDFLKGNSIHFLSCVLRKGPSVQARIEQDRATIARQVSEITMLRASNAEKSRDIAEKDKRIAELEAERYDTVVVLYAALQWALHDDLHPVLAATELSKQKAEKDKRIAELETQTFTRICRHRPDHPAVGFDGQECPLCAALKRISELVRAGEIMARRIEDLEAENEELEHHIGEIQ